MKTKTSIKSWWFTIEPYVYVGLSKKCVLLYNTLDGVVIESDKIEVIELLKDVLRRESHGVILLSDDRIQNSDIKTFIHELREKYMGDIIDVTLSKEKPIQLLPFCNFFDFDKSNIYRRHNFSVDRNVLEKLFEISVYIDSNTNCLSLISFLESVPERLVLNIVGKLDEVFEYEQLFSFLNFRSSPKNIICAYTNIIPLQSAFKNNFSYSVCVDFPIDFNQWERSTQILRNQTLPYKYIFNVLSLDDCYETEKLIERFHIKEYQLKPVYNGNNMQFFRENVFLSKQDILSMHISIKNIFANQSINTYNFGKLNIMSNGDVFANVNLPLLGNIYKDSIYDLVRKEISNGESWLRIRNQAPCNECIFQWLCPSPSDYEIVIGYPNLCHVM